MRYILFLCTIISLPAFAECTKPDMFGSYTCRDRHGNVYNITKSQFSDTTRVEGRNIYNGNTWSQKTTRFGNTTTTRGHDSYGRTWESTHNGNHTYGHDADGNYFSCWDNDCY